MTEISLRSLSTRSFGTRAKFSQELVLSASEFLAEILLSHLSHL